MLRNNNNLKNVTYQFNSAKTSNSKSVNDVEVRQLQVGEEGSFGFVSGFFYVKKWKFLRGVDMSAMQFCSKMKYALTGRYHLNFHLRF